MKEEELGKSLCDFKDLIVCIRDKTGQGSVRCLSHALNQDIYIHSEVEQQLQLH